MGRSLFIGKHTDFNYVEIAGSFAPAGTGAPTTARGVGYTVARTNVGEFTLTFVNAYPELVSREAHLSLATPDDKVAMCGVYTAASKTLVINIWDISGAALADVAADANNLVNFRVVFKESGT